MRFDASIFDLDMDDKELMSVRRWIIVLILVQYQSSGIFEDIYYP